VVNRTFLSFRAAFRTLASPWDTLYPALCRERVRLMSVLLDQPVFPPHSPRQSPVFVRVIHRYYTAVRLLEDVHAGSTALASPAVLWSASITEYLRGLPVLVHEVSRRALGSLTTQDCPGLAISFPSMWLSATVYGVSILIASFRSSIPSAHLSPVYASLYPCTERGAKLGPSGFARPFS